MTTGVRYIVDDVPAAIAFYVERLGFAVEIAFNNDFADRAAGVVFRGDIVTGRGGSQGLLEDPAGNAIELIQPARI